MSPLDHAGLNSDSAPELQATMYPQPPQRKRRFSDISTDSCLEETFQLGSKQRKSDASIDSFVEASVEPERSLQSAFLWRHGPRSDSEKQIFDRLFDLLSGMGLRPDFTGEELSRLLNTLVFAGMLDEALSVRVLKDPYGPDAAIAAEVLGTSSHNYAYLGAKVNYLLDDKSHSENDPTVCDVCKRLYLSYILGHTATFDDVQSFGRSSRAVFNLAHVNRNQVLPGGSSCRVCKFFRECMTIERASGNPSKPKFITMASSEFCGVKKGKKQKETVVLEDTPCIVFAPKKKDRQGFVLPTSSPHRAGIITGRKIQPDEIDFGVLGRWLSFCLETHGKQCQPRDITPIAGLRVIDCHTRRLIPLPSAGCEYLALSYMWGGGSQGSVGDGSRLPDDVPNVIEDALIATRKLGFRHLWVDRYCIPQDNAEEKHSQIKNMGRIYAQCVLTIICAAGDGPDLGLPGVGATKRIPQPTLRWGKEELVYCFTKGSRRDVHSSKWNSRGWTYQEGLLARRRLVFTERQAYFQCQAMHQIESVDTQLNKLHTRAFFAKSIDFGVVFPSIQELQRGTESFEARVYEFVHRNFTYESDALDAFRGILATFEDLPKPIHHFFGLPLFSEHYFDNPADATPARVLAAGLSWQFNTRMARRPEYPSWTWVGWKPASDIPQGDSEDASDVYQPPPFEIIDRRLRPTSSNLSEDIKSQDCSCSIQARFETENGVLSNWENDLVRTEMVSMERGKPPRYLLLTGWATEGTLNKRDGSCVVKDQSHKLYQYLYGLDLDALEDGQPVLVLILRLRSFGGKSVVPPHLRLDELRHSRGGTTMVCLILKRMPGNKAYERVGCVEVSVGGHLSINGPTRASIKSLLLERKEVRLE